MSSSRRPTPAAADVTKDVLGPASADAVIRVALEHGATGKTKPHAAEVVQQQAAIGKKGALMCRSGVASARVHTASTAIFDT